MGHHIQAMVSQTEVADAISARFPCLPRVNASSGFAIFPVDAEFIDAVADPRPPEKGGDEFMLLTAGFRNFLRDLSLVGKFAYIETEYFGGTGGQGAVVYSGGVEVMAPAWSKAGIINSALKAIGVPGSLLQDRFSKIGLKNFRSNDDLIEVASVQNR